MRQGVGLGTVGKDVIPAAVTTARLTTRLDTFFSEQARQLVGNNRIQGSVHAKDEMLLPGNGALGANFNRTGERIALLNKIYHYSFIVTIQLNTENDSNHQSVTIQQGF